MPWFILVALKVWNVWFSKQKIKRIQAQHPNFALVLDSKFVMIWAGLIATCHVSSWPFITNIAFSASMCFRCLQTEWRCEYYEVLQIDFFDSKFWVNQKLEIEIGSGEVVFDRLHMTKHSEYITDKAEIESYSSALSLYVSVVRETQNHSFSISILEVRQILHYLMRKRKQAGTCIRCEDLSVYKEYWCVKRDGINWNFVISK